MKNHVELAYLLLLVTILILNPSFVSNFKKTVLGKLVLVLGVVYVALCNKIYGMVAAFLTVCLMQNMREGMVNNSEDDEDDEDDEEMDGEEMDGEDLKEGMGHQELENEEQEEEEEDEEVMDRERDEEEADDTEAFTLLSNNSSFHTSSMDRLAADEMLKSKPSNTFPVNKRERRGQNKSVVDNVLNGVKKLFK